MAFPLLRNVAALLKYSLTRFVLSFSAQITRIVVSVLRYAPTSWSLSAWATTLDKMLKELETGAVATVVFRPLYATSLA